MDFAESTELTFFGGVLVDGEGDRQLNMPNRPRPASPSKMGAKRYFGENPAKLGPSRFLEGEGVMRTIEEAFNDVTNSVNSELLAGEAMYIEYRTTGKLSATRALDIGMRFYRRGIELDDAHGVVGPRSPRMTISLLTELARNGPEFVFREGSEFWLYEATPEQKKKLFRRAREHQEEADNDDRS